MPPKRRTGVRGRPRCVRAPQDIGQDKRSVVPPLEPDMGQRVESVHESVVGEGRAAPVEQPIDPVAVGI